MKKILLLTLAAFAALGAGCSKDAGVDGTMAGGKYTLPEIAGTLDGTTRTGLGTNQVVNWSNKDRIAVVNTKTNTIWQYELVSGYNTPVGKFEPVADAATYDDIADIKAVYPAIAARCTNGVISFEINKDWDEATRTQYNISSWSKDSPYSFTYNDIKVSYNTPVMTSNDATQLVNFKFKQLGTWCGFTFDFTTTEYTRETLESMTVTTTAGTKKISGVAEVDLTDPVAPSLKEGTETSVEWLFNSPLSLAAPVGRSLMLFPGVNADQLKITLKTNLHVFTFYATPTQSLDPGMVLRFPINVDQNFHVGAANTDFAYTVEDNGNIPRFYYYGSANSYLLATDATSVEIDAAPYQSNVYFEKVNTPAPEKAGTTAELLWYEGFTTEPAVAFADNKITVSNIAADQFGNASVALKDAAGKILWSYHIWKPEIAINDANLLTYSSTSSGSYKVMPIALGAMNKVTKTASEAADASTQKTYGLYYQWGRKDPLGRPGALTASGDNYATTTFKDAGLGGKWNAAANMLKLDDLTGFVAGDADNDVKMIQWATENPTKFIWMTDGKFNNNWTDKTNDNLWGNPTGYNYPKASALKKSIYDPCPAGYRVAPKDLWLNFTLTRGNFSTSVVEEKEANFNAMNATTMATQRGYFYCFLGWHEAANVDFYPASGFRNRTSGALTGVGSSGLYWSSAPASSGSISAGGLHFSATGVNPLHSSSRAYGFTVRCVRE